MNTFNKTNFLFFIGILVVLSFFSFSHILKEKITSVAADKMNVLYIGVNNPLTVAVEGVNDKDVSVQSDDIELTKLGNGKYNARATKPGNVIIDVVPKGAAPRQVNFRVKRIPDPIARLGRSSGGSISLQNFKDQTGVNGILQNFDFDAKCVIRGFYITRRSKEKDEDVVEIINKGGKFSKETRDLVDLAKPGDVYYFDQVKARCPGDPAGRMINSMVFKIK